MACHKSGKSGSLRQNPHFIISADKAQLFGESVERHFGIESDHFNLNHFDEVNKFIEDNHRYFFPPEDPDDYQFDVENEHELVADVDIQTLIKLVKFLKKVKNGQLFFYGGELPFLGLADNFFKEWYISNNFFHYIL